MTFDSCRTMRKIFVAFTVLTYGAIAQDGPEEAEVVEEPAAEEVAVEEPAAEEAAEEPVVEEAAEEPVVEEAAAEEPAAEVTTMDDVPEEEKFRTNDAGE